ncbi:acyl-CoA dehydrogenase family protein [Spongisporangium articulatum]|uniref:Acyl-CoA dehydrogenase family protein n=1 Tax=Spongisporangium articulatum TaxID=3362603 RepID=A0ABW8ATU1_9ACTN
MTAPTRAGRDVDTEVLADVRMLTLTVLDSQPADLWSALGTAGLSALGVPSTQGGAGLDLVESAVLLRELGRRAVDSPALANALGVLTLARWGTARQHRKALYPVVHDGAILTVGLHEPSSPLTRAPRTAVHRTADGLRLDGALVAVPYADRARHALVPAAVAGEPGLVLLDLQGPGVHRHLVPTSSGTPVHGVRFDGVALTEGALVPGGPAALADLHRLAAAASAAYADGLVDGALALTARHVETREQFGRPLATLQAVAQQLADVYVASRTLHLAAEAAIGAADHHTGDDPDGDADPEVAALLAVDSARTAIATCHHLHGGTGVDLSYPLPAFSAAARDLARLLGGPGARLDALAARVLAC